MASGWWDNSGAISGCVAAYQPIGAASLAASYTNKANPGTYDAAPGVAPTFATATGWAFSAARYLRSGVTPSAGWTMILRYSGSASNSYGIYAGSYGPTNVATGAIFVGGYPHPFFGNGGFAESSSSPATSGVVAVAGPNGYYNGSSVTSSAGTITTAGAEIYIGGANDGSGTLRNNYVITIAAFAVYSATLSASEIAALTILINALPVASIFPTPIYAAQLAAYGG